MVEYTKTSVSCGVSGLSGTGVSSPLILNEGGKFTLMKISEAKRFSHSADIFSSKGCKPGFSFFAITLATVFSGCPWGARLGAACGFTW